METDWDLVSALLRISEGGINFFASCLLYLDPNELKMCRLVNRAWDEFIRKEVWGSKRRRLLLKERLLQRWKNVDPDAEEFSAYISITFECEGIQASSSRPPYRSRR